MYIILCVWCVVFLIKYCRIGKKACSDLFLIYSSYGEIPNHVNNTHVTTENVNRFWKKKRLVVCLTSFSKMYFPIKRHTTCLTLSNYHHQTRDTTTIFICLRQRRKNHQILLYWQHRLELMVFFTNESLSIFL